MEINFHLPNFTELMKFNLVFSEMHRGANHYFREGVKIASLFGVFPPAIWNGGRFQYMQCDRNYVKQALAIFDARKMPLRFTFTNPMLEEKHLSDDFCNFIMKTADNGINEVIVVSELLEDYIRKNYPRYKITSSTCKRITTVEGLNAELAKDYNLVVADYDLNNDFAALEKVTDKGRCEILINAICDPRCKNRRKHYDCIGLMQIEFNEHLKKKPNKPQEFEFRNADYDKIKNCPCMTKGGFYQNKGNTSNLSVEDLYEKYVPMGFRHFKIEGRSSHFLNLMETYLYYMVKAECRDEARYALMIMLKEHGLMQF